MAIKVQSANNTIRVGVSTGSSAGSVQATYDPTEYYSNLARDWAIKMDGKVQEEDYSSKYYAQQSKNSCDTAIDMITDFDDHVQQVQDQFDANAQNKIDEATIWAEGTDEQVQALGGEHSAKGWAELGGQDIEDATTDTKGIIQIATEQEADEGLSTDKAMTPALVSKEISDNVGRGIVLGFDGILENNVLIFTPTDGIAYDLKNNYDYEIDLHFPAVGLLPDDTDVRIINGLDEIAIRNVLSGSTNATYGDLRQVCDYIEDIGWRWIFTARYKSVNSDRAFVMQATTVALQQTLENASEYTAPSTKSVVDSLEVKADKTNTLNHQQISNCILEAPQMHDVQINGGILALKAGSKVIVPYGKNAPTMNVGDSLNGGTIADVSWDGSNLFYIVQYNTDLTKGMGGTPSCAFVTNSGALEQFVLTYATSGSTPPTSFQEGRYALWYDTSANLVKATSDGGANWAWGFSLIVANFYSDGSTQNFQSFGYIGGRAWVNKGVKALIPNDRNADGTLNNTEVVTQYISFDANLENNTSETFFLNEDGKIWSYGGKYREVANLPPTSSLIFGTAVYVLSANCIYTALPNGTWDKRNWVYLGELNKLSAAGNIEKFKPQSTYQALDANSLANNTFRTVVETYRNGASWYRVYSDGWCEQGGIIPQLVHNVQTEISLLMPCADFRVLALSQQVGFGAPLALSASSWTRNTFKICQFNSVSAVMNNTYWEAHGWIN